MSYLSKVLNAVRTPQSEQIPGSTQVANSAGGFAFEVDKWMQLTRFVILGSEGGSYYASEQKLSLDNAKNVLACIQEDGVRTVNKIVAISDTGRAPKNDPALYALAMCAGLGNLETRKAAYRALPKVARIGTHLFHFLQFKENFSKWNTLSRKGISAWYENRDLTSLAEQAVKYQQRDGWGHGDIIRLSHPHTMGDDAREALYRYMSYGADADTEKRGTKVKKFMPESRFREVLADAPALDIVRGTEAVKTATSASAVADLIRQYNLPREVIPTQWLDSKEVWATLLPHMGITALIRNLAKMTSIGLLASGTSETEFVLQRLADADGLRRGRVHPITILLALMTYKLGHGIKGSLKWEPLTSIIDALDRAFYLAFANVEPSNVAWEMWLDISGSMGMDSVAGIPGFTPRHASAAMALVNAVTEPQCEFYGFSTSPVKLNISARQRLDDVITTISGLPFGGTDCSLPMQHALAAKRKVDVFAIYTDSETWFGSIHPVQALREYRAQINQKAKLIVVGLVGNKFSIADPSDAGSIDFVGFDAAAPSLMSLFASGKL